MPFSAVTEEVTDDPHSVLDLVPSGIVFCGADGRIEHANALMLSWLGLADDSSLRGKPFHALLAPAGKIYFETHLRPILMVEGSVSEISLELRGRTSERRRIYLNAKTQRDATGQVVAIHFACFEGAQRFNYERELLEKRRTAEVYAALVDASPDAIIHIDGKGRIDAWNRAAQRMLGYSADEAMGRKALSWLFPEKQAQAHEEARADTDAVASVVRTAEFRHADGSLIPVELHSARLRDENGEKGGLLTMVRDISERKQAEDEIRTLNQEIIHRSKNQFAVIQAIARSTERYSDPSHFVTAFSKRLDALSKNLTLLNESGNEAIDLHSLASQQLLHLDASVRARIHLEGPKIKILERNAQALGLALFELSTNALKYGALSERFTETGRVEIQWEADAESNTLAALRWRETGARDIAVPRSQGFGSRLTGVLLERSTGGEVCALFEPTGLVWSLKMPANRDVEES